MRKIVCLVSAGILLAGCTTTGPNGEQTPNRTATGAIIGAIGGAIVGNQVNSKGGALAGAIIGGAGGAAIGNYMDRQEKAFNDALASEKQQNAIKVQRVRDDLLKLTLENQVSFDVNSTAVKPSFRPTLDKLAKVLRQYNETNVMVVGYTDSTGSAAYNQRLSKARAAAVGDYLVSDGVERMRLSTEGRGEEEPRATNATAAGREMNRRVEIFVKPNQAGAGST